MPIATTSDQFALQASLRDWAKQAAPLAAVRRLEPGAPVPAENGTTQILLNQVGERVLRLPR